jgi:50S ribosomal protein L16 3-hydroxylase
MFSQVMSTLLGGLKPADFLAQYWHKRPLLVPGAVPDFSGLLSPAELKMLSADEDVESRLVSCSDHTWKLEHGPFSASRFRKLPKQNWTLLVQSVNHHLASGGELLDRFNFIPHARLDDLMVSYARPGGGVGPHFDSYDVFLLQGQGHRRWRISAQKNLDLIEGLPLKILEHFTPEQEYVLGPGDMLYLPPHYAHDGVAEDECMTYSIGFRAPSAQEIAQGFLDFMRDRIELTGQYADPDLTLQKHSAEISFDMLEKFGGMISHIQWNNNDIAEFVGEYLSEPKPHVYFSPPTKPLGRKAFEQVSGSRGMHLNGKTRLLFANRRFFINGEMFLATGQEARVLKQLADRRRLPPQSVLNDDLVDLFFQWYRAGWLDLP